MSAFSDATAQHFASAVGLMTDNPEWMKAMAACCDVHMSYLILQAAATMTHQCFTLFCCLGLLKSHAGEIATQPLQYQRAVLGPGASTSKHVSLH